MVVNVVNRLLNVFLAAGVTAGLAQWPYVHVKQQVLLAAWVLGVLQLHVRQSSFWHSTCPVLSGS